MSSEIENQIEAIVGVDQQPRLTKLHYIAWGTAGLLVILFAALFIYVVFFLIRTLVLLGIVNLIG
jgi:hypothetical protein